MQAVQHGGVLAWSAEAGRDGQVDGPVGTASGRGWLTWLFLALGQGCVRAAVSMG